MTVWGDKRHLNLQHFEDEFTIFGWSLSMHYVCLTRFLPGKKSMITILNSIKCHLEEEKHIFDSVFFRLCWSCKCRHGEAV